MKQSTRFISTFCAASIAVFAVSGSVKAGEPLEYNRDIRPILANACFACHGPDSAARQADLRLDQRETAIDMGAIEPEDPDASEMIRRVLSSDRDELMPPPETKKSLNAAEKERLVRWIREGAEYELHWSLIPPERPQPPAVGNAGWVRNPIDSFVAFKLESLGLQPAPEADRRTLARRVSLDLTGLPPSPELVEQFASDSSAEAYATLVDTLLDSQQWGEHRGRYWLDYARYADTHGIHFDNYREMWSYRDWVIRAFNNNMPFNQFTIENLAGDLLPGATLDQQIASGFNRCNMTTNEGGIIDEEYLVLYTRDRIETTSQVWLGLTAGCAVCHSHKFDPLSQNEFYELAAFFNNTTQKARDGNVKDTPPIIAVPRREDRDRWNELPELIAQAKQALEQRRQQAQPDFEEWLASATPATIEAAIPKEGLHLRAGLDEGSGDVVHVEIEGQQREVPLIGSTTWQAGVAGHAVQIQGAAAVLPNAGDFASNDAFTCAAWVRLPASDGSGAICARMDEANAYRGWDFWTQRRQIGMHVVDAWPEKALKVVAKEQVPANEWVHVAASYDGSGKAAGIKVYYNGQPQSTNIESDKLSGPFDTDVAFKIGQRSSGAQFTGGLQDLRIFRRALTQADVAALAIGSRLAGTLAATRDGGTVDVLATSELWEFWLRTFDESFSDSSQLLIGLEREQAEIKARGTIAHVMHEQDEPAVAYVLNRGEYDQRGDEVQPGTPEVLPAFPEDFPRNRLGFAKWLLLPDHPLTARVTVNRFWQEVFGTGLVETAGDFGVQGELPSHPELLDWLAIEFRESGWDVKQLFKLIVTSATYRQSAVATAEKLELDPDNRYLGRGPRFRMDAEMVRDYALATSGLLVQKIGGPSVKPYQPPGVWEAIAMNVSNTRAYEPGTGEDLYRRSLYTFVKRMAPPASMDIFNAPNREYCIVRRERTNTALQALVTLNDEQFIEAARHLAQRSISEGGPTADGRLEVLGQRLLLREFRPEEKQIIQQSLDELTAFYTTHPDEAHALVHVGESEPDPALDTVELAVWTMLANELMNLDEVLNK